VLKGFSAPQASPDSDEALTCRTFSLIGQFDHAIIGASRSTKGTLLDFGYREVQAAQGARCRSRLSISTQTVASLHRL
jgi:hypothetical protein